MIIKSISDLWSILLLSTLNTHHTYFRDLLAPNIPTYHVHYRTSVHRVCPQQRETSSGANFCRVCARPCWMRGHDVSSLHAAGNQLQTVEQRSAAVNGAGGALEPYRSSFFTQGKAFMFVMLDRSCPIYLIHCYRQASQTSTLNHEHKQRAVGLGDTAVTNAHGAQDWFAVLAVILACVTVCGSCFGRRLTKANL